MGGRPYFTVVHSVNVTERRIYMKQISELMLYLVLSVMFLTGCGQAGNATASNSPVAPVPAASSQPKEDVVQALTKMERDWTDAILKKDIATIERIVAEDCIFIVPDGRIMTRDQTNEDLKAGVWSPESLTLENIKVRAFGDTAVVTLLQIEKSKTKGKDTSGRYLFTDIFVKRNGSWQVVAEHGSRLEPSKP